MVCYKVEVASYFGIRHCSNRYESPFGHHSALDLRYLDVLYALPMSMREQTVPRSIPKDFSSREIASDAKILE